VLLFLAQKSEYLNSYISSIILESAPIRDIRGISVPFSPSRPGSPGRINTLTPITRQNRRNPKKIWGKTCILLAPVRDIPRPASAGYRNRSNYETDPNPHHRPVTRTLFLLSGIQTGVPTRQPALHIRRRLPFVLPRSHTHILPRTVHRKDTLGRTTFSIPVQP